MIFQHTWQQVLSGEKTATRRIVKPGDYIGRQYTPHIDTSIPYAYLPTVFAESGYPKWSPGKTYAVQTGRTAKGIARIRITGLRAEDVRNISRADVAAEGFQNRYDFFVTWLGMHDKGALHGFIEDTDFLHNTTDVFLATRPAEKYQAWVIEFELVRP